MYAYLATKSVTASGLVFIAAGALSNGYFNPATTLTMVAGGFLGSGLLVPLVMCQILGSLAALELFRRYTL